MADNTIALSAVVTGPGITVGSQTFHNVTNLNINFLSQVLSFNYLGTNGQPEYLEISMASISAFSVTITSGVWAVTFS